MGGGWKLGRRGGGGSEGGEVRNQTLAILTSTTGWRHPLVLFGLSPLSVQTSSNYPFTLDTDSGPNDWWSALTVYCLPPLCELHCSVYLHCVNRLHCSVCLHCLNCMQRLPPLSELHCSVCHHCLNCTAVSASIV